MWLRGGYRGGAVHRAPLAENPEKSLVISYSIAYFMMYTVRRNANNLLDLFNWTVAVKHI